VSTDLDDAPELAADEPTGRPWPHGAVLVLGVVALLLFGAAGGFSVARSTTGAAPAPAVGSVDVGFAQDMSVHHDQAVTMATIGRDDGSDPRIRTLAADMAATQTSQIGRMQGWLELWGAPALPLGGRHMEWMSGGEHAGAAHGGAGGVDTMPGMASSEELARLRAATGPELDTLFLQLMLRHHQGGAGMLAHAAQHAAAPQVRNLASQMLRSQAAEERQLQQLLAERGAERLPFP
jgi:uncharacterized protein (DUF305 family)